MLRQDVTWPESFRYQTNSEWEPAAFFSESLCNSTSFDLMLGFFSSAAINVLACGFATFLHSGGRMRMIVNDMLSHEDAAAISLAGGTERLPYFNLGSLAGLVSTLGHRDRHFFECLAWLIRHGRIEIRVVRMAGGRGIPHTKCGVFDDGCNVVAFDGSVNFSLSGLLLNKESLSISCDWNGAADRARIKDIRQKFESAFAGEDADMEILDPRGLTAHILRQTEPKGIAGLLRDEADLIDRELDGMISPALRRELEKVRAQVHAAIADGGNDAEEGSGGAETGDAGETAAVSDGDAVSDAVPHFPYPSGPRPYQQEAFERWKGNGQRGFFAMATGTGKTITSLNCLLEIYRRNGYYKCLILVPSTALVDQWADECRKFGFGNVVKIYSLAADWKDRVSAIETMERMAAGGGADPDYVLISTYRSFASRGVYGRLTRLPRRKVLLIADEAHNIGADSIRRLLPGIPYGRRIGLSATPYRQYDAAGNRHLGEFFGFGDGNYTFSYEMREAIANGVLCRYRYYPHLVSLNDTEYADYIALTARLARYLGRNGADFKNDSALTALLIQRKRIVHKAVAKQQVFREILEEHYRRHGSLKYTLVYVPEGSADDTDAYLTSDDIEEDTESLHLIDRYTSIVREIDRKVTVAQFTAESRDRRALLEGFASGEIDVLTSMKCLDEGVDVPRSQLAVFCASTGNPRQFVQRRGRILRTHPDKTHAVIHDLIVAPMLRKDTDSFSVERNLLMSELRRVKDFSSLAENPTATLDELLPVLNHYNLTLYDE